MGTIIVAITEEIKPNNSKGARTTSPLTETSLRNQK